MPDLWTAPAGLSPWPPERYRVNNNVNVIIPEWSAAVLRLARELAITVDLTTPGSTPEPNVHAVDHVDRLGLAASDLIEHYAPSAPDHLKDESVIRLAGYLRDTVSGKREGSYTLGTLHQEIASHHTNAGMALRHSGVMAFLSPWRVHGCAEAKDDDE